MKTRIVDNINDNQTLSKEIDDKKITIIVFFAVAVLSLAALAIGVVNVSNRYVKDLINRCEKMGLVEYDDEDMQRSFVLVEENGKYMVRLSRISAGGLKSRALDYNYDKDLQ